MMWKAQLDEALEDDTQVVTYKWLSRTARVPANTAKQMLYTYLKNEGAKAEEGIKALYLVAGLRNNKGVEQHRFLVVPEDKLPATKAKFDRITSEHIYSLQRTVPKDLSSALFQVDMPACIPLLERNKWGTIECSKMERREAPVEPSYADTTDTMNDSMSGGGPRLPKASSKPKGKKVDAASFFGTAKAKAKAKPAPAKSTTAAKRSDSGSSGKKKLVRKIDSDEEDEEEQEEDNAVKSVDNKAKTKTEDKADKDAAPVEKKADGNKKDAPTDKESKAAAVNASAATASPKKKAASPQKNKGLKREAEENESTETKKAKAETSTEDSAAKKKSKAKAEKRKSTDKDDATPKKKAKAAEVESESPAAHAPSITDAFVGKKTRTVTKKEKRTFMNDKGYMVTEVVEVEVEEEIDEDEGKPPSPKKTTSDPKKSAKKSAPTEKKKQASMMSFFKKK
eukprot:m.195969 g.195969  ORF g.195969 m.195969 type:complete len:453 (+) comp19669_c0_seq1:58-1416(+)